MNPKMTARLGTSRYGNPEPQVLVHLPRSAHYRAVNAALLRVAADIELATPPEEGWCVQVGSDRVFIELADATPAEATRAMRILSKIAG